MCNQHIYIVASNATVYRVIFALYLCKWFWPVLISPKHSNRYIAWIYKHSCLKIVLNLQCLKFTTDNENERGENSNRGKYFPIYSISSLHAIYIHIHCIIHQPDQTLNTSKCLYLLTTNFVQHVTIWNVIYLWINFFLGGGGWGSEFFEWECQSTLSNLWLPSAIICL